MYKKFIITKCDKRTTSTGKNLIKATLKDFNGNEMPEVAIWDTFPNFHSLNLNSEVMGAIIEKPSPDGKYINKSLQEERTNTIRDTSRNGMKAAQERKGEMIKEAQENKNESIKLAATMRDATLLTVEWLKMKNLNPGEVDFPPSDEEIKKKWLEWRKFFDSNFGDGIPF